MLQKPFKNLKIVELASVLAGPAVGMFFAELGAEVIKIENKKTGGDVTRNWKLPNEKEGDSSAYFKSINWGKQSIFLDLSNKTDKDKVLELLSTSDIVLTNFKKGSAKKLGLDYPTLKEKYPQLIYANLNAYGEQSDKVGFDVLLQAETGYLYMNGEPNGKPSKMPVALIDLLAAHQLKEAILIALLERYKTNKGSFITTSLAKSAIASLANQASNFLNEGFIPQKMGSQHPNICPYGDIFNTKDGKSIVLAIGTEKHFQLFCKTINQEELATNKLYLNNALRVKNRDKLIIEIQKSVQNFTQKELLDELDKQKVPAGVINDMKAVFELSVAKEMILEDHKGNKCVCTIAFEIYPNKV